jgi:spore germination protein YaaH
MKPIRLIVWLIFVLILHELGYAQQKLEVLFAYRPSAFTTLEKNIDQVSIVAPEPFIVDKSGVVYGAIEPKLLRLAKEHNVKVMPQIKNLDPNAGLFNQEWVHGILTDAKARQRTIKTMLDLCKQNGLWGMQIDFENVHINDREALTNFYREAADALHQEGYKISIAVVHRAEETAGPNTYTKWMMENWRGAFDLKALGEIGDFVKIMSYAQHTRRTTPGPSQGLPWLEQVIQYFLQYVPPEKLNLGITMSASHYYTIADTAKYYQNARSWSSSISLKEAQSLIEQYNGMPLLWDDKQKVLFGYIERGGVFEWFFVDNDLRSFDAKLALVKKYKLRGINCWISGGEDPRMWESIKNF